MVIDIRAFGPRSVFSLQGFKESGVVGTSPNVIDLSWCSYDKPQSLRQVTPSHPTVFTSAGCIWHPAVAHALFCVRWLTPLSDESSPASHIRVRGRTYGPKPAEQTRINTASFPGPEGIMIFYVTINYLPLGLRFGWFSPSLVA